MKIVFWRISISPKGCSGDLTVVVRDHAPDAKVREMAARIHEALEQVPSEFEN
jgi:hypothetical protein